MTYPSVIFLLLLLWSFSWPKEKLVYLLFGSVAFNSLAVIPPDWVGGLNLLPNSLAALVMIGRYAFDRRFLMSLGRNALDPSRMGLLTGFIAVALISSVFFARMFANQVEVVPMRGLAGPLYPSMANFTQMAYLMVSYLVALIFYYSGSSRRFTDTTLKALLLGGVFVALTGLADLIIGSSGAKVLLDPFKTAEYVFMVDNEVQGVRRVVGVMTEASAFGSTAVVMGAITLFAAPLFPTGRLRLLSQLTALFLILLGALSTSSTAYVGLVVLVIAYLALLGWRGIDGISPGRHVLLRIALLSELGACYLVVLLIALIAMMAPDVFDKPAGMVDELIFKKSQGGSYLDRMSWNRLAIQALWDTGGIGVGVGSARVSNWFVGVISNTGVLGAGLLFSFLGIQMVRRPARRDRYTRNLLLATRATLVVNIVMAGLSATSPDFGLTGGAFFGLIVASATARARVGARARLRRRKRQLERPGAPRPAQREPVLPQAKTRPSRRPLLADKLDTGAARMAGRPSRVPRAKPRRQRRDWHSDKPV
jgi:hypothetical protein